MTGPPCMRDLWPPSVDASGAAGDQLGTVDAMARFEGLLDGGLIGLAGGGDGQPLGGEGVLVVDLDGLGLAGGQLVIGDEKRVAEGCGRVSTSTRESSRASARPAAERESSVSRLACCWR